jgi:hypothetical protein
VFHRNVPLPIHLKRRLHKVGEETSRRRSNVTCVDGLAVLGVNAQLSLLVHSPQPVWFFHH